MPWTIYQMRVEDEEQPFYIGCTSRSSYRRWIEHKHRAKSLVENSARGKRIKEAEDAGKVILVEDLETLNTQEEAHQREVFWIDHYGRYPFGPLTNTEAGGNDLGKYVSDEARRKMSAAKIGNKINVGRPRPDFREKTRKDITAFEASGKLIGSFETARLASEATGVSWKTISQIANGNIRATKSPSGQILTFRFGIIEHDIDHVQYRTRR